MKKRIMILTHAIPYYWERGASLRVHMMAKGLTTMGNEVEIVTTHLGYDVRMKGLKITRTLRLPFVTKVDIGFSFIRIFLGFLVMVTAFFVLLKRKGDLIIAEGGTGAFWGLILKKLFRIPLVYDMHNSLGESIAVHNINFPLRYANLFDLHLYRNADFIIANSESVRENVLKLYPTRRIITIFDRIVDDDIDSQADFQFMQGRYIIYVGNFAEYQGVDLLINAFCRVQTKMPDVNLVLIGAGLSNQLRKLVLGNNCIYYLGKQPISLTNRLLKGATVAAFPVYYSAVLGMKLIHYIQFGKAIVATNRPRYGSILVDKDSFLLCNANAQDMAEKLVLVLSNGVLRRKLEANARRVGAKVFSLSALKKQLGEVLTRCLNE